MALTERYLVGTHGIAQLYFHKIQACGDIAPVNGRMDDITPDRQWHAAFQHLQQPSLQVIQENSTRLWPTAPDL